jgi:hypothetical protein
MITPLTKKTFILAALALFGFSQFALAGERTALSLIKDANDYVGKDVRDHIVQIRSEKSVASTIPNIWYVVFYDKDATFRTTEVKFAAGVKQDVKRTIREPFAYINDKVNDQNVMDQNVLKIDSNKAIKTAMAEPLLDKLTIHATQLWLERMDGVATWRVRLWAAKLHHPNDDANVGDVFISAESGKVLKTDLHIDRVD